MLEENTCYSLKCDRCGMYHEWSTVHRYTIEAHSKICGAISSGWVPKGVKAVSDISWIHYMDKKWLCNECKKKE